MKKIKWPRPQRWFVVMAFVLSLLLGLSVVRSIRLAKKLELVNAVSEENAVRVLRARHGKAVRTYASLVYLQNGKYCYMAEYSTK